MAASRPGMRMWKGVDAALQPFDARSVTGRDFVFHRVGSDASARPRYSHSATSAWRSVCFSTTNLEAVVPGVAPVVRCTVPAARSAASSASSTACMPVPVGTRSGGCHAGSSARLMAGAQPYVAT
jgi:hypothetical protein